MLEKEFNYFLTNQEELVRKHSGKFVVIHETEVVGNYETLEDAYVTSSTQFPLGAFLIQECQAGREIYTAQLGVGYF